MKINSQVTGKEHLLGEQDLVVSQTDIGGLITHVNAVFLRIGGFDESELIGRPHNIVRHPDMPAALFADMWAALKANRPWTGLVKNRCKNGDFYWSVANATPVFDQGRCTGYLCVRSKASAAQISAAEQVYAQGGRAGSIGFADGRPVRVGLLDRLNPMKHASVKFRMLSVLLAMAMLMIVISSNGLLGMSRASEGLRTVYEDRTVALGQLSEIKTRVLHIRTALVTALSYQQEAPKQIAEIEQDIGTIDAQWRAYLATAMTPDEKALADKFAAEYRNCIDQGVKPAMELERVARGNAAEEFYWERVRPLCKPVTEGINSLVALQMDAAKQEYQDSLVRYVSARNTAIALVFLGLLMALWEALTVFRGIIAPIEKVVGLLQQVSQGKYDNSIDVARQDEIGKLLNGLKSMQIRLGFDVAEALRISNENLRIRIGLDNVSTSVVITDNEHRITYMNHAAARLMNEAEADIRRDLPGFDAARLMGASIDEFHAHPEHQRAMLENLKATHRGQIELGGRTFAIAASPVMDGSGQRLGAALEWNDRTVEVSVEKEVAAIVGAAAQGDFTRRIAMQGKEGFFRQLALGINQLMETSERGLQEIARMLGSLARGDLTDRIDNEYSGTFGRLKDDANATSDQLKQIITQIRDATEAINTAASEIAAGNVDLSQRTEEQASSLEQTASSMEQLTSTVKQNAENARQANQLAIGASDVAGKGGAVVNEVVATMDSITESSKRIVDIISVIDGIAFQTNILALNAAVEAARAGEQGRGFAVVASEVRNLAQRSAAAAHEIKSLITDSVDKVEGGSRLVAEAGRTMDEIVSSIRRVTDIVTEISAASNEQSQGIEQVCHAITQMDQVTQQNASLVEQAAATAGSLEEQANSLSLSVGVFRI